MLKKPILTIDGPAASGKGSVSKKIAQDFDLYYLERGLFYRLLALDRRLNVFENKKFYFNALYASQNIYKKLFN